MASAAVGKAMNLADQQGIHPFFARPNRQPSPSSANEPESAPTNAPPQDENQTSPEEPPKKSRGTGRPLGSKTRSTKRKSDEENAPFKVKQASIAAFAGLKKEADDTRDVTEATSLDADPNIGRRKRQKTATPEHEEFAQNEAEEGGGVVDRGQEQFEQGQRPSWLKQLEDEAKKEPEILLERIEVEASSPNGHEEQHAPIDSEIVLASSPRPANNVDEEKHTPAPPSSPPVTHSSPANLQEATRKTGDHAPPSPSKPSQPKKMLRLNARGRFSSPISKHPKDEPLEPGNERRTQSRGKKKGMKQLIVKISYIKDDERAVRMAEDIDEILAGNKRVPQPRPIHKPDVPLKVSKPIGPPKPTHPFFTGKAARNETKSESNNNAKSTLIETKPLPRRGTAITPGKLKAQMRAADEMSVTPCFGMAATKQRKIIGGIEAPWPWKGIARVGDCDEWQMTMESSSGADNSQLPFCERRKFKGVEYAVPDTEAILSLVMHDLRIGTMWQDDSQAKDDGVSRFPKRLLTTGPEIRRRVQSELHAFRPTPASPGDNRENQHFQDGNMLHPALKSLFNSILDTLTPFDRGLCESLPWVLKYAPKRAVDVLGSSIEVSALRKWLEALKVNAVEGALKELVVKSKKNGVVKAPKKKRKKEDLDDFVVSDDNGLDELTDPDEAPRPDSSHGALKSMIRLGGEVDDLGAGRKLHNLVLLSGPHGSGKTAAVFAVAKELDFEVFEINAGSRRSGKDVLERIGDMTENHLVQRQVREQPEQPSADSDAERLTDAIQNDIQSGRQKNMSSFFKPVVSTRAKPTITEAKQLETKATKQNVQATLGKTKQRQKQSLILLEEVDVLFEEDKNFWQTVEHLAVHSKRPIVMTCTDESLVRLNESSLHAILRMSPAATELATDYLLLLAAKEGHLLPRRSIADLYESKNHDLRASIMELNFWCQMAVGDRKGGLEWIYQRWPPGTDIDEHGQTLRVASDGTYQTGMGWIGHDVAVEDDHVGFDKEYELMLQLTESWNIEPENYSSLPRADDLMEVEATTPHARLKALQDVEQYLELSSAADVYCRVGVPTRDQPVMDPTQPPLPEKSLANFTDGYTFIQADAMTDFTNFDTHLAVSSHLAARRSGLSIAGLQADPTKAFPQFDEVGIADAVLAHLSSTRQPRFLSRTDFFVFDPLAEPPTAALSSSAPGSMTASSFDRTFRIIVEDLAPYVRNITMYELRLEQDRMRGLMSADGGGKPPKRQRTTRAARSALEGGKRENTRRERWFGQSLNLAAVMKTAGREWAGMGASLERREYTPSVAGSARGGSDVEREP
ncbi:hypothetical protein B0J12DRAFT_101568 [Macrophomina phaseolina]|uniref:AAA+ ATPase domain-containing protein n=1 Tax=Macrophomina phaseolina TaxID=35725 RepID=A0ABQ8GCE1_9PEZI|nr:hypothetical protein B0J12DRAFT_101568 [Macrophomina phaseolina]